MDYFRDRLSDDACNRGFGAELVYFLMTSERADQKFMSIICKRSAFFWYLLGAVIGPFFSSPALSEVGFSRMFAIEPYAVVLGFDLRNDSRPAATISVSKKVGNAVAQVDLGLPFRIKEPGTNEDILLRVGVFDNWTLLTYLEPKTERWPQEISFAPVFDVVRDQLGTDLPGSLYFSAEGQLRRFLYRYPVSNRIPADVRAFDAVAVAIPKNATPVHVRGGKTEIPARERENEHAWFFPARPAGPNEPFLEVRYSVPATSAQKLIVEYGTKLLAGLLPILILIFQGKEDIRRPERRRIVIGVVALLYILLFTGLASYSHYIGETGTKLYSELVGGVISLAVAGVIFWAKNKPSPEPYEV